MDKTAKWITYFWFLIFIFLLYFNIDEAKSLELNEWGDLLAGITAPVAFLWLIVGYRLQKNELMNNTKVLEQQQLELSKQVKELSNQNKILMDNTDISRDLVSSTENLANTIERASFQISR